MRFRTGRPAGRTVLPRFCGPPGKIQSADEIDAFYIAGEFGQSLDIENAILIGLLPDLERKKFSYLGNTSLLGAYLICLSDENRRLVVDIAKKMTYLELNTDPGYMNESTGALFLPDTQIDLFPSVRQALHL